MTTKFINELDNLENDDKRIMFIANRFVDDLMNNDITFIDQILQIVEVEKYTEDVLIALLSFTYVCKDDLKYREEFYNKAYIKLQKEIPQEVDELFKGLK
jgi:hypothetical protein